MQLKLSKCTESTQPWVTISGTEGKTMHIIVICLTIKFGLVSVLIHKTSTVYMTLQCRGNLHNALRVHYEHLIVIVFVKLIYWRVTKLKNRPCKYMKHLVNGEQEILTNETPVCPILEKLTHPMIHRGEQNCHLGGGKGPCKS